jgi:molybdopterin/thiamine biosynthesis adenylyltransferase
VNYCGLEHKIKIIGLGGIGSILSEKISRFLNYLPEHKSEITLVDGDTYEQKNFERQEFTNIGNKAKVKTFELESKFDNIEFKTFSFYVNNLIIGTLIEEGDIVFLAVDNHKTRKIVSDFAKTLDNIILISGGNDFYDGNVQIYVRKGGEDVTPSLTDYHPEIDEPDDKSPDEMGCEELSKAGEPQLYFANLTAATMMCCAFYNVLQGNLKASEVYFDIKTMKVDSKSRELKK